MKKASLHGFVGAVAVFLVATLGWQLAGTWYLRDDASFVQVGLAAVSAVLGLIFTRRLRPALPITLWVAFSLLSIVWSLSPAASVRAGAWHLIYLSVFLVGLSWPRLTLGALVALHFAVLAHGIDLFIATGRPDFNGVWYQQNVQGGQLLLIVSLLAYWAFGGSRYAPYAAFGLGVVLFTGALTYSTASQVLLLVGFIVVFLLCRQMLFAAGRLRGVSVGLLLLLGLLCGWLLTQPEQAEVLSVNFGGSAEASVSVSDPSGTFLARWRIIKDVGRRALAELPLGTGTGTLRHLYSSLQTHPEIESVDAHNYYLQTLMTLGVVGVVLLVWFIGMSIWRAYRVRHWGLAVSLFLFAGYLAFDVMAYYPGVMLLFFGALGVAQGLWVVQKSSEDEAVDTSIVSVGMTIRRPQRWISVGLIALFPLLWAVWLQPCDNITCFAKRKFGDRETMQAMRARLSPEERLVWAHVGLAINPDSLYYERRRAASYDDLGEFQKALEHYRAIAEKFPAADLDVYRDWRDAALWVGDTEEALEAVYASREYYGRNPLLVGF